MKIRPVEAELFHADGRTDMMKLIMVSRNFANAPKREPNNWKNKTNVLEVKDKRHSPRKLYSFEFGKLDVK
jgi:hypothetical protein